MHRPPLFTGPAEQYDRWVGRFLPSLATAMADFAGVEADLNFGMNPPQRTLDVGCGPGELAQEFARRVGEPNVSAIDHAPPFTQACQVRIPRADVRIGTAEELPWTTGTFDVAASLVVGSMTDPARGIGEMARVVRRGGTVAACMWDLAGDGMGLLHTFWSAVSTVDPEASGEPSLPGGADGQLTALLTSAGLQRVMSGYLEATAQYAGFDDFWEPFTFGLGAAGQYLARISRADREAIRGRCRAQVPDEPFELTARAWCAKGQTI